jgi:biotin carboxyl carrier protein
VNLRARLDGEPFDLDVRRQGEGDYCVRLGDEIFAVHLTEPEPGVLSLRVDEGSYEAVVRPAGDGLDVTLAGRCYRIGLEDPAGGARAAPEGGSSVVRSQMAGKVLDVLVAAGDEVEAGRPLLVIEAMKMENEVRSPRQGTVRSVAVRPGQPVETGAELVVVE